MAETKPRGTPDAQKPYHAPEFRSYGSLAQMTEMVGNKGAKDGYVPPKGNVKRTLP